MLDNPDALALHDTYQALCNLRLANPELFAESAEFVTSNLDEALSIGRYMRLTAGDKEIVALINTSITSQAKTISVPVTLAPSTYKLMFASPGVTVTPTFDDSAISAKLPGGSFAVFATSDIESGINDAIIDSSGEPVYYYDLQGRIIDNPTASGLYIRRQGYTVQKVLIGSSEIQ